MARQATKQTDDAQPTTILPDKAPTVMRYARQNASPDDVIGGFPDTTEINGDASDLFEDGDLRDAADVKSDAETTGKPADLTEWLERANPERYARYEKAVETNMFPNTSDEELLNRAVRNELDENGRPGFGNTTGTQFTVRTLQNERPNIWNGVDNDAEDEQDGDECPECDSTNTSSYQQQTGGADEGMTSFHKCAECGHSWRGGY